MMLNTLSRITRNNVEMKTKNVNINLTREKTFSLNARSRLRPTVTKK